MNILLLIYAKYASCSLALEFLWIVDCFPWCLVFGVARVLCSLLAVRCVRSILCVVCCLLFI